MLPGEIARCRQHHAQPRHPRPRLGQQKQVDQEADHVGGQVGHGLPDRLPGVLVAVQTSGRLSHPLDVVRVLRVGEGGAAEVHMQVQAQGGAHRHPSKEGIFVQVGPKRPHQHHPQGEPEDQPDQRAGGRAPLHRLQDGGHHEQLQQAGRHAAEYQSGADGQHALALPPGPADHEGAVGGHAVGGLLLVGRLVFHVSHLKENSNTKAPGCVNRGLNCTAQGLNGALGGSPPCPTRFLPGIWAGGSLW